MVSLTAAAAEKAFPMHMVTESEIKKCAFLIFIPLSGVFLNYRIKVYYQRIAMF